MNAIFTQHFDSYVCAGDTIETTAGPLRLVATIKHDSDAESPEENGDGFWPSLDPESAGYIGPKSKATLARQTARAQAILDAWRRDEWFYCGVVVQAYAGETPIGEPASLWNVECNFPQFTRRSRRRVNPNAYLLEVANELAPEALESAQERLEELADAAASVRPDRALAALQRLLAVFDSKDVPARIMARQHVESVVAELTNK